MTYFHRRTSTIIGAKAFHDSVRDGKAWVHLAMVVKRNRLCHGEPGSASWRAPPARQGQSGKKQVKCLCVCWCQTRKGLRCLHESGVVFNKRRFTHTP